MHCDFIIVSLFKIISLNICGHLLHYKARGVNTPGAGSTKPQTPIAVLPQTIIHLFIITYSKLYVKKYHISSQNYIFFLKKKGQKIYK